MKYIISEDISTHLFLLESNSFKRLWASVSACMKLDVQVLVYYRHTNREHMPIHCAKCFYLASVSHSPHAQFADSSWKILTLYHHAFWGRVICIKVYWKTTSGWQSECTTWCLQANTSNFCLQPKVGRYKPAPNMKLQSLGECSHTNTRLLVLQSVQLPEHRAVLWLQVLMHTQSMSF